MGGKVLRLWNLRLAAIIIFWFFILHILPVHRGPPATRSKPQMRLSMENDDDLVTV